MNILKTKILTVSIVCVMLVMLFVPIVNQNDILVEEIIETEGSSGQIIIPATIVTEKILGSTHEDFLIEGFGEECGGTILSYSTNYGQAEDGTGSLDKTSTFLSSNDIIVGQSFAGGTYWIMRTYIKFDTHLLPPSATITGGTLHSTKLSTYSPTKAFDVHIYTCSYGIPLSVTAWNPMSQVKLTNTLVGSYSSDGDYSYALTPSSIKTASSTQFMLKSSREGTIPTDEEFVYFGSEPADYFYLTVNFNLDNPVADAGTDQSGYKGWYSFNGWSSTSPVNIDVYEWTFTYGGLSKTLLGGGVQWYFDIFENYEVTLYVEDEYGLSDTDIMYINVQNTNPVANAGTDQSGLKGTYDFVGSASYDLDTSIADYSWEFTYDGFTEYLSGVNPNFNFQIGGAYTVILTVEDTDGGTDTDDVLITITNRLPVANAGTDESSLKGTYDFDGSGSYDLDGSITDYSWEFTYDGFTEYLSGVTPNFDFQIGDAYTVILTVTGDEGDIDTDDVIITIINRLPVANAGIDNDVFQGIYDFDGSASYDLDGFITNYDWEFTYDGSTEYLSGVNPNFDFQIADIYTVTLTVTGDEGDIDTDDVIITVINRLPVANAGTDQIGNKRIYDFDGSASYDPDSFGSITNYDWEFTYDGSTEYLSGVTPNFNFQILGTYTVTLTVTDDDGGINTDTVDIIVNMEYSPIRINSDIDFTALNGVTGGTGTSGDPYIIDGWIIDGTDAGNCIYVGNTTKYFEIKNCLLHLASITTPSMFYTESGVQFYNVNNGNIINNNIELNDEYGILIEESVLNFINGNIIDNCNYGIYLKTNSNNNITKNLFENCDVGVKAEASATNNMIYHNNFVNNVLDVVR